MEAVGLTHAALRIDDGFTLSQLVAEYRALRASVLRLFEKAGGGDLHQVTRFNESIDEALVEATDRYMTVMNRTRDQFIAVLGHDLRSPLSAIFMSAGLIAKGVDGAAMAAQILRSGGRMARMVDDLLDLTRTRLGSGIPITPGQMDLDATCRGVFAEIQAIPPRPPAGVPFGRRPPGHVGLRPPRSGRVESPGECAAARRSRQTGPREREGRGKEVVIEVHNDGSPIPPALLANIFEPMVSHARKDEDMRSTSVGLGLHIAREIVLAHGGTVTVTSTAEEGTTFSVRLPHRAVATPPPTEESHPADEHDATGGLVVPEPSRPPERRLFHPPMPEAASSIRARSAAYSRTTGYCGKASTTFCGGRKRMPAWASASMAVSLYESPAAMTRKFSPLKALTASRFWSGCRRWYAETKPAASVESRWQKRVGNPSCSMRGMANS